MLADCHIHQALDMPAIDLKCLPKVSVLVANLYHRPVHNSPQVPLQVVLLRFLYRPGENGCLISDRQAKWRTEIRSVSSDFAHTCKENSVGKNIRPG